MTQELSKNNWVLVLKNDVEIYLGEDEYHLLCTVLLSEDPPKFVRVQGSIINVYSVVYLMSAKDWDDVQTEKEHGKRNDWKCEHGRWIDKKYKECGC